MFQLGTGTFAFLAPEQIIEFRSVPATDIWGAGAMLHWLYACTYSLLVYKYLLSAGSSAPSSGKHPAPKVLYPFALGAGEYWG
jgi:serine/threonine protein kinase